MFKIFAINITFLSLLKTNMCKNVPLTKHKLSKLVCDRERTSHSSHEGLPLEMAR